MKKIDKSKHFLFQLNLDFYKVGKDKSNANGSLNKLISFCKKFDDITTTKRNYIVFSAIMVVLLLLSKQ